MSKYPLPCLPRQFKQFARRPMLAALLIILVVASLLTYRLGHNVPQASEASEILKIPAPQELESPTPQQPSPTMPSLEIPKRLHHYFGDLTAIPDRLSKAVNSWANNHKDYEVYFWDSRYLEKRLLPGFQLYQRYRHCYWAERHTVARLLILLTFGGVLVDPDLISIAEYSNFLDGSTCVVAQELPEVAAIIYGLDALPSLRFAACRPKHSFLQLLLDRFCAGSSGAMAVAPVGPIVTGTDAAAVATASAFRAAFDAAVSAYDDECARRVCDHRDRVVLADAGVFLPVVPAQLMDQLLDFCRKLHRLPDSDENGLKQRACQSLSAPSNRNLPGRMALAKPLEPPGDPADGPSVALDRIEQNVGRRPILNIDYLPASHPSHLQFPARKKF